MYIAWDLAFVGFGRVAGIAADSGAVLVLVVASQASQREKSAIVSLSTAWVVTNYEEMIRLLRYFDQKDLLDTLSKADPLDRPRLWREFFAATDPNKATPENEALDRYFGRLARANQIFRDEGVAGWRTDRGEVFIVLGEPDEIYDSSPLRGSVWRPRPVTS